jgi:hypothetical protein
MTQQAGPDLTGWALVQSHGLTLLGKITEEMADHALKLSPVYSLNVQVTPKGIIHLAFPVWGLDVHELTISPGAIVHHTSEMDDPGRASLARAVERIEQMMGAQKAGIVIPGVTT